MCPSGNQGLSDCKMPARVSMKTIDMKDHSLKEEPSTANDIDVDDCFYEDNDEFEDLLEIDIPEVNYNDINKNVLVNNQQKCASE